VREWCRSVCEGPELLDAEVFIRVETDGWTIDGGGKSVLIVTVHIYTLYTHPPIAFHRIDQLHTFLILKLQLRRQSRR
jgi:hypothetical protein